MDKILEVKNLDIKIKDKHIIKDISFDLREGRNLGIIGESGAGKSMTIYAISSLLPPKDTSIQGEIIYKGQSDLLKLGKNRRKFISENIGLILQDSMNSLNPYETIERQMVESLRFHHKNMSKDQALDVAKGLLENVGFQWTEENLKKYPHEYSGGMRQRVSIALALTSHPKVLIADEPTTALDAVNQRTFISFLKDLCSKKGISLIYISHNLALTSELCQDVIVMDQGRIVESGPLENVFSSPKHPTTKSLVQDTRYLMGGAELE